MEGLQDAMGTIIDLTNLPSAKKLEESETDVLLYEFMADLNAYLSRLEPGVKVRSLRDVIEFNDCSCE